MASFLLSAQNDVTQFMGIPVDGFKYEMIQKLKEKGFVPIINTDLLEGEFNGRNVYIGVASNNNKVFRIGVIDKNKVSESDIKIRFNKLCQQFANNPKYICFDDYTISDEEDISYEMSVKNKRYQASFYQRPNLELLDTMAIQKVFAERFSHKYTEEQLANPTEEVSADLFKFSTDYTFDLLISKSVWFMIDEEYGQYYIKIFYDNEYNKANGEDL